MKKIPQLKNVFDPVNPSVVPTCKQIFSKSTVYEVVRKGLKLAAYKLKTCQGIEPNNPAIHEEFSVNIRDSVNNDD
ncbi:hypothetical protein TNCT_357541 [Trichonephila clavata]|uniref:Uncharacterized protein n=1 Tax=Trichonephila clavata TaxID=2740835 RepID=A0A8X6K5J9_TRICU|nr:hypothetical protein TNCT_357541 [Trichonephila clavata]